MLTVYGIETVVSRMLKTSRLMSLQQCLPFTVLKPWIFLRASNFCFYALQQCLPFTVLKPTNTSDKSTTNKVATVLTVYGIETYGANPHSSPHSCNSAYRLRYWNHRTTHDGDTPYQLQQCLPFTVLKLFIFLNKHRCLTSCNSAYRLRYWN